VQPFHVAQQSPRDDLGLLSTPAVLRSRWTKRKGPSPTAYLLVEALNSPLGFSNVTVLASIYLVLAMSSDSSAASAWDWRLGYIVRKASDPKPLRGLRLLP
jgi:hypothetical protein